MPLPPGARVGTLPDGTLTWIDANGQPINPDGSPIANAGTVQPLQPAPNQLTQPQTQAATQPGVVQVPAGVNIDQNASVRPATTSPAPATPATAGAAGATGGGGANPRQVSLPAGTSPVAEDMLRDANTAVDQAHTDVAAQSKTIQDLQSKLDAAQTGPSSDPQIASQLTSQINSAYNALSASETRLASASKNQADTAQKVLDSVQLTPEQADYYRAQAASATANANKADADTKVLLDGADTQKAATAAQAGLASANALLANTNAQIAQAKSQPEIDQINAQADALRAQADQTRQLLPGLLSKQSADTSLTQAQARLTDSQSALAQAQVGQVQANTDLLSAQSKLLVPAQAQQAAGAGLESTAQAQIGIPAQAQNQQAQAALAATTAGKNLLGPAYGLQQQVDAIRSVLAVQQHVFGPGGSGNPQDANDLLDQYVRSTVAGTTPYAASVAAANAQQNQFQTQAAMYNQASQSAASRANAYAGMAGGMLGTLEQMNAYAPKGSTAMAGAFSDLMDAMANRLGGPSQFVAPAQPQAPQLPTFLQGFVQGHQAGTAQSNASGGGGGQAPTINVNVNGAPASGAPGAAVGPGPGGAFNPQASTAAMNAAGFMDNPAGRAAMSQMFGGPGAAGPTPTAASPVSTAPPTQAPAVTTPPAGAGQPQQTPGQAFAQGLGQATPPVPNYLQMYGLNLPSPMQILNGQPYVGMGV